MKKFIYSFLRKYIEKHYDFWGTKIETDLPPEFIITEHAYQSLVDRFSCRSDKLHKIMIKAWSAKDHPGPLFQRNSRRYHKEGIYKMFMGYVFVFRVRYNKKLGCAQKYLITVFKKNGYQIYDEH